MMLATARRNLSPFVPYLATTLNVDVQIIAVAIAAQRFIQIITLPLTPALWKLFQCNSSLVVGKARVMVFAVLFLILCLLLIAYGNNLYLILIVIGLSGAAKAWFDPSGLSLQRNVLRNASPRLRGVAAAGTEFNWGLASLVGVPVSGVLLSISFTLPFLVLAITTAIMLLPLTLVLYTTIQEEESKASEQQDNTSTASTTSTTPATPATPATPSSSFCAQVCLVFCSVPTLSNMFDAMCSALFMSNKDMSFGLWLNQTHHYDQLNVARVSTIFGGADLLGEVVLVGLLAKGINALHISQIHTLLLMAAGLVFMWLGPISDVGGLAVYFFMSMFNEIKAVSTLTLGALNAEPGLEGLAETSTYLGQAVGFTIGVLTAPMVWELGKEQGVGIWFLAVGGLCLVNHLCLAVWQYQTRSLVSTHPRTDVKHEISIEL